MMVSQIPPGSQNEDSYTIPHHAYRSGFRWAVTCFYGQNAKPPKRQGELAIQTVHMDEHGRDLEVRVSEERSDIGKVIIDRLIQ